MSESHRSIPQARASIDISFDLPFWSSQQLFDLPIHFFPQRAQPLMDGSAEFHGAGKTTFAREFLPHEAGCPVFVNADLIAAGLAPFAPETAAVQAGRLMLQELDRYVAAGESFAFETTLSGRGYVQRIRQWQAAGYRVKLIFLQLDSAEEAMARVAQRVRQGGHDIPEATIRRRFAAGRQNFERLYAPLVDAWVLYDNAGAKPVLLDWSEKP